MRRALEGGARLRVALRGWPSDVDARTRLFLRGLPWRWRRAVELVYGAGMTQDEAAIELCVSQSTIARDLDCAAERYPADS